MTTLRINSQEITVNSDLTILAASRLHNIDIPTLCQKDGYTHFTSCMICVVLDKKTGKMLPACSIKVADGMDIETDAPLILSSRKKAIELLLSEHIGDCEGPCQRICPAHMHIPNMIRLIQKGAYRESLEVVKEHIALPAVLGRICPAPCENGCRRAKHDSGVSICLLKRFVADVDLSHHKPFIPYCNPSNGKRVAVIGAGPTGLSAAYYLLQQGYAVGVFDSFKEGGGMLRYGVDPTILAPEIIDAEIDVIRKMDCKFFYKCTIGKDFGFNELEKRFDAIIIAIGTLGNEIPDFVKQLKTTKKGIAVDKNTFQTSIPTVFAGGNCTTSGKLAVRSCAHGKTIACSVDQFLMGRPITGNPSRLNIQIAPLLENEMQVFLKLADESARIQPVSGGTGAYSILEAKNEAMRCLHCDCRKPHDCKLREYAERYDANPKEFPIPVRKPVRFDVSHQAIVYEPGKCIKCGLCVRITEQQKEKYGLTFIGRGFNTETEVPFNEPLSNALTTVTDECVSSCPTGALAYK